jgi:hypothetical protein
MYINKFLSVFAYMDHKVVIQIKFKSNKNKGRRNLLRRANDTSC